MTQPNFVLFITDQQRADYLGCYGHPVLKTPQIDAIAAAGVRFERFFVSTPICMPNRATLMTGRMPSLHGVRHNGMNLSLNANTFVDLLRASGYRTALVGKSHLQNFTDTEPLRQPDTGDDLPASDEFKEAMKPAARGGPYEQERAMNWLKGPEFPLTRPYYGFEHIRLCTRHGDQVGGHYFYWLKERCDDPTKLRGPKNALPHKTVCPQAWRTAVPEELYPTTFVEQEAISYLRSSVAAGTNAPFFLQVSFPDPHHPFTPPGRYWDMYQPEQMTLPNSFVPADPILQPHVAWMQQQLAAGKAIRSSPSAFAVHEREALEAMALTCGMLAMIDDAIGRVMAEISKLGLSENTVIVFTSDHGDFLGDHQLLLKGPAHFQGLIRVPFIWSDPANTCKGATSQASSATIDVARTILDRAKVKPYNGIQGCSLLPFAADPASRNDRALLIEEDGQRTSYGFDRPVRCRSLLSGRWRMTVYGGVKWGELYDLENDPDELHNLWFDTRHAAVRGELTLKLAHAQLAAVDTSPLPTAQG